MKKFLYLSLLILFSIDCSAQSPTFEWAKKFGGNGYEHGSSIALDGSGNILSTGYFQTTTDFDPNAGIFNLTSNGNEDIFVSKNDASGNFVWAKKVGGSLVDKGQSIAVDIAGNVLITGTFQGTVDFDPGAAIYNLTAVASNATFILKLDAAGNFVWAVVIDGSSSSYGTGIKLDTSGNVYATGYYYGTCDFDPSASVYNSTSNGNSDIFILKLNSAGNFMWVKSFGGANADNGRSITVDALGNLYTTGSFESIVDFDPSAAILNLGTTGNSDQLFILKLNALGNLIWAKSTNTGSCIGLSINVDANNNVFTTGSFQFTVDFDPGTGVFNMTNIGSYFNIFVSKLDPTGNFLWAKGFGTTYWEAGRCITNDIVGNVYITGEFRGTMDMDPGASIYNLSSFSINNYDAFILKLDALGNLIWAKNIGATTSVYGYAITVNSLNEIFTIGDFFGTANFNTDSGVFNITSDGTDVFIHKISQAPCINPTIPSISSSATTICSGQSVTLSIDTGSLYSAAAWKWYAGSCGGTLVGTGNSISLSPSTTTTYYVRGEGGCITPSACTFITINVNPSSTVTATNVSACAGNAVTLLGSPVGGSFSLSNPYLGGSTSYTYSYTNSFGCTSVSSPATITINSLPSVNIVAIPNSTVCVGSNITLTASGANSYSWSNGNQTPINNIPFIPSASSIYTVTATSTNGCTNTNIISVNVSNQQPSTTSAARCGSGSINLSANGSGTLTWYDAATNGNLLQTGNSYSPTLSTSSTFYVDNTVIASTSNITSTAGPLGNTIGVGAQSTLAQYQLFNVLQPCTLQSVVVYPGAAGNVILEQRNASGTIVLNSTTLSVTAAQVGTAVTMTLNWPLSVGIGYRIYRNAASVSLYRNSTGGLYPYSNSSITITGNSVSTNNYWWAYNWTISTPVNNFCTSTRVPVDATIHQLPIVSASNVNGCAGSSVTLIGSPAGIGGAYSKPNPYLGSSTNYIYFYMDSNGCSGSSAPASITIDTCNLTLITKLYLQGYYVGTGIMTPTLFNQGIGSNGNMTDVIFVELHDANFPYAMVATTTASLNTNGFATCIFKVVSGSYYVVIKHRNSIETWSANPIVINTSTNTYDFSLAASNAYGSNMKQVEPNVWAIYSGDINQDDNIDLLDAILLENDINYFYFGYYSTDLNGDGNVDLVDVPLLEENIAEFISTLSP